MGLRSSHSASRVARRRVLRGLGGVALSLPFLEYFAPKPAHAVPPPNRYAFFLGGMSIGVYGGDKMAPAVGAPLAASPTRGLQPLTDLGVADVVSLVSGLSIPTGTPIPAGGRPALFHSTSHQVLATGQRYDEAKYGELAAPSSDWVAAETLAPGTVQPVLVYAVQAAAYRSDTSHGGHNGIVSARINGNGDLEQVPPVSSPRVAYESLFTGFIPTDPTAAIEAKHLLALRKSVVDLVADDAGSLVARLGKADGIRMQRHFDELRSLEKRLEEIELPGVPACQMLRHPGDDPPVGDAIDPVGDVALSDLYTSPHGYSNEELRATIMTDLIHMAFACDISRVASVLLTYAQSFMNMYTLFDYPSDLHEITHSAIGANEDEVQDVVADCAAWHVKHFARLVQKLRDTEDVDGSSMLDHTAIALAFEGGWGFDPESNIDSSPHSTENMVMLVGGKAGGLNATAGRHIEAKGAHPAAVLNTCLQAIGGTKTLGEVPDLVDALFG